MAEQYSVVEGSVAVVNLGITANKEVTFPFNVPVDTMDGNATGEVECTLLNLLKVHVHVYIHVVGTYFHIYLLTFCMYIPPVSVWNLCLELLVSSACSSL